MAGDFKLNFYALSNFDVAVFKFVSARPCSGLYNVIFSTVRAAFRGTVVPNTGNIILLDPRPAGRSPNGFS